MYRFAVENSLLLVLSEKDTQKNQTLKEIAQDQGADLLLLKEQDGNYYGFNANMGKYLIEEEGVGISSLYRAVGNICEDFFGRELHGEKIEQKTELDKVRRDLHIFMLFNAADIEDWLWDALNEAIYGNKEYTIEFLNDYEDTSLVYMGWQRVDIKALEV